MPLGYPPGGFPRTLSGWVELIHPEDRERILAEWDRDKEEALPEWSYRYRLRAGDGSYVHLWDRGRITAFRDGKALRDFADAFYHHLALHGGSRPEAQESLLPAPAV